jgi:hypothetical protein
MARRLVRNRHQAVVFRIKWRRVSELFGARHWPQRAGLRVKANLQPYNVAESLDERTNLAAMDWQDFENLIREYLTLAVNPS